MCFDLVTNLNKSKFAVEVAAHPNGLLAKKLAEHNIAFHPVDCFRRGPSLVNDIKSLILLYKLIKSGTYDIVHCHSTKAGILGRTAAKLACTKKIYFSAHGWGFYNSKEYGWTKNIPFFLERIVARWSTRIVCVSEKAKNNAIEKMIAKSDKFLVINNGISWYEQTTRDEVRTSFHVKENEVIVGFVGRLAHQKEPLIFLKAALIISQKFNKVKFFMIGDGPLNVLCKNFIKQYELENNCILFGERNPEETRMIMVGFDIIVSTSIYEGFPIVILEAMHAGLPVVATNVGGVSELIIHGHNGFLVAPGDVEGIASEMTHLIVDEKQRKKMGIKNKCMLGRDFSLNSMVKNYENLYESQ